MHLGTMLNWAGMLEVPKAIEFATNSIKDWVESSINRIPSDLHTQTYCNAIIGGDKTVYDTLQNFLNHESDEDIQQALARGLGCSKDKEILLELRKNITTPTFLSSSSPPLKYEILIKLARNPLTRETLVEYLDENFDEIKGYFEGVGVFVRTFEAATQYWNTNEQLQQLEDFIEKYNENFSKWRRRLKRIVDQIQKNIVWAERFSEPIKAWFRVNQ